jgi:hypothetical protein
MLSTIGPDKQSPQIPLPSHAVFSCCASAGLADQSGGESLGLVAASFQAGASKIIATAVDVPSTAFTNTWDDRLLAGLAAGTSHFVVLREEQLRALTEWRECVANPNDYRGAEVKPHPAIWAYYQAFGTE